MYLHYPRCLGREHPLKWYFLCTTTVYLIICTMVKLRLYQIQIIWFKYSIPYPCSRSMIHSGLQFAQCWTSFNLIWIKSRATRLLYWIANDVLIISYCEFFRGVARFTELVQRIWVLRVFFSRKKLGRFPPPKIISCHSPIQKGTLSAIKLQFHMADMRRTGKNKMCQKWSNLPLVFHVMDCWTLPCMPPYTCG